MRRNARNLEDAEAILPDPINLEDYPLNGRRMRFGENDYDPLPAAERVQEPVVERPAARPDPVIRFRENPVADVHLF